MTTESARERSFVERHGPKLVLSLFLGGGLGWLLAKGGLPVLPDAAAIRRVPPWIVILYISSFSVVHVVRAIRWRHLLRPLGTPKLLPMMGISWVGFCAILLSPLRTGEFVRPYLLSKRTHVRLWEAAGTIGAERVLDGLTLSLVLAGGLAWQTPVSPLPDHVGDLPVPASLVRPAAISAVALFLMAFVVMLLVLVWRERARNLVGGALGRISMPLADRVTRVFDRLAAGLLFLPHFRSSALFLAETMLYWAVNAGGLWLLAWGCGLTTVGFADAIVVMGCIGLGILVPSGPGYFGAFQLSAYMALALVVPEGDLASRGAVFVFLVYTTQVGLHLFAAIPGLIWSRKSEAEKAEAVSP